VGRTTLLRDYGFNYRELDAAGFRLPVLDLSIKYLRPARYDDEVEVHTVIRDCPGIRLEIDYEIRRDEELLVTAHTRHAFVDANGQPVRPPAAFREAMRQHFAS